LKDLEIRISGDTIRYIYDDSLAPLMDQGQSETMRASHVEPEGSGWVADLGPCGGPKLGPFQLRQEALDAEVSWIQENRIPIPENPH